MENFEFTDKKAIVLTNQDFLKSQSTISILNVYVSRFKNFTSPNNPVQINLLDWLNSLEQMEKVDLIRSLSNKEERDKIKSTLLAITPSGTFSYRSEKYLIKHNGFIQFDIDYKENPNITNYPDLKSQICNIKNVAYCGLSVSGTGFWGLIPIGYPEKHKQHFEALRRSFNHVGIVIDEKPKNVASLRGYSYDKEAYFNHNAAIYYNLYEQAKPQPLRLKTLRNSTNIQRFVEACISEIVKNGIDITDGYQHWFELGCSLGNQFGEAGRQYFHIISQYNPGYKRTEADKQYSDCLQHKYNYTISTFFEYCKVYQITFKGQNNKK